MTKERHERAMLARAAKAVMAVASPQCGVLIVEDDPDLQWRLARMLTVQGHRVVGTSTGEGALALMAQWPVDLVLVDEHLPGANGLEVSRRLGEMHPDIPVFLMTTGDDPDTRLAARLAGVVTCLVKPFRVETLTEALRALQLPQLAPAE